MLSRWICYRCQEIIRFPMSHRMITLHRSIGSIPDDKLHIDSSPPDKMTCDWIGPPDRDSNLRLLKFYVSDNETPMHTAYRKQRQDTQEWNRMFWAKHNRLFQMGKAAFIESKIAELGKVLPDGTPRKLKSEELSEFYKKFLDDNYLTNKAYNREWYKRNLMMLWPALKIALYDFMWKKK